MSLETYLPITENVAAGGETLAISPLRVRQVPPFLRAIGPAAGLLAAGNVLAAVAQHGEALIEAAAIVTGKSVEWLGDLMPDEFIALMAAILSVNADFFVQRVNPHILAISQRVQAMPGATPSPSSLEAE